MHSAHGRWELWLTLGLTISFDWEKSRVVRSAESPTGKAKPVERYFRSLWEKKENHVLVKNARQPDETSLTLDAHVQTEKINQLHRSSRSKETDSVPETGG